MFLDKTLYSHSDRALSTRVYNWVSVNIMLWGEKKKQNKTKQKRTKKNKTKQNKNLQLISVPETGVSSGQMSHLARMQATHALLLLSTVTYLVLDVFRKAGVRLH